MSTITEPDVTLDWYTRPDDLGDEMFEIPDQTEADYFRRAPENRICEFIDGVVYMPSPADFHHQADIHFLNGLLEFVHADRPLGIRCSGPTALRLRPDCNLEPDLFILPLGGESQVHGYYCDLPALLVVEVLSPSNRSHDLNRKASLYRAAQIPVVLFIDNRDRVVIAHRRTDAGYEVSRIEAGPVHALPGFWFDAAWLWAQPPANIRVCLDRILAGPPAPG